MVRRERRLLASLFSFFSLRWIAFSPQGRELQPPKHLSQPTPLPRRDDARLGRPVLRL